MGKNMSNVTITTFFFILHQYLARVSALTEQPCLPKRQRWNIWLQSRPKQGTNCICVAQSECDIAGFSGIPGLLPCLYTLWLYLVCCTVLLWVIMWNPDWCAGHVVCAVISDVHRTLRSHRSLPLGEMEFVCVREWGVCLCVCVCA